MSGEPPVRAGGLTVRGGPAGSAARVEDLERFAAATARAAAAVSGVAEDLARSAGQAGQDGWTAALAFPAPGATLWPAGNGAPPDPSLLEARRRVGEISWRADGLRRVADDLGGLAARARLVATAFATADASVAAAFDGLSWGTGFVLSRVGGALLPPPFGTAGPAVAGAPSAGVLGSGAWAGSGLVGAALLAGPAGAAQPLVRTVPGLVSGAGPVRPGNVPDLALSGLGAARLSPWLHESTHVVLQPVGPATRAPAGPPSGAASVVELLERAGTGGRGVLIERITAPDGRRSWVVAVPGLQTWSPTAGENPYDLTAAVRAMARRQPAVAVQLAGALEAAGVRPGEPVLLAGHSLGGMAVAQAAADPAFRRRFTVTHVLTAGSPVAHARIPSQIRVLSLEHDEDVVPALDGADNPDRPRWVTVRGSAPGALVAGAGNARIRGHDVRAYRWTASRADRATTDVLAGWRAGFDAFAVTGGQVRTWRFEARRAGSAG